MVNIEAHLRFALQSFDFSKCIFNGHQSAVADGLFLSEDHRLGVVLSQHDPRGLQPLHHLVETLRRCPAGYCVAMHERGT